MKLPETNIKTEESGVLQTVSFGIGDLRIIFDILRNKLYKDPILAVVREYLSNARDAHREMKTPDKAVEVYLPSAFSLQFKIKDYGPGISPDRMENIFVNYASSTKRNDNEQLGGFGIGSKSSFSYTDTFSVETIHDYVKYVWTAFIDESEIGKMTLMSKTPTDEPPGTTIIVPVKLNDKRTFKEKVKYVTEYWDVKPIIFGDEVVYDTYNIRFSGTGWKCPFFNTNSYYTPKNALAIIDGIQYDIATASINGLSDTQLTIVRNARFLLSFGIGELSLAASRDSLHYDEKTQQAIKDRLSIVEKELNQVIENKIMGVSTYTEAVKLYAETAKELNPVFGHQFEKIFDNIMHSGHLVKSSISIEQIGKWATGICYERYNKSIRTCKLITNTSLSIRDDVQVYHNDRTDYVISKDVISYIFDNLPTDKKIVQIIRTPKTPKSSYYDAINDGLPTYDFKFLKLFNVLSLKAINLPKVKTTRNYLKTAKSEIKGYEIKNPFSSGFSISTKNFDKQAGGVYVVVDYIKRRVNFGNVNFEDGGLNLFNYIKTFIGKDIIGLSEDKADNIKNLAQWVPLETELNLALEKIRPQIDITKKYIIDNNFSTNLVKLNDLSGDHEINKFVDDLSETRKFIANDLNHKMIWFLRSIKEIKDDDSLASSFHAKEDKINNKYPLLKALLRSLNYYGLNDLLDEKRIVEYINLIDKQ